MHPMQVISYFGQIHSGCTILHRTEHPTAVHLFAFFCPLILASASHSLFLHLLLQDPSLFCFEEHLHLSLPLQK